MMLINNLNRTNLFSNKENYVKALFFNNNSNKRFFSKTQNLNIEDNTTKKNLQELKTQKYEEHFDNKNNLRNIDESHEDVSHSLTKAILTLFNNTIRDRDRQNVWGDTSAHARDKMDLTTKHWELGRKCKDNSYDSDANSYAFSTTDSNHSTETLNLEREREFLQVCKEKIYTVNEYNDSIKGRLETSDIKPDSERISLINRLLEAKNNLTQEFNKTFSKQEETFNKYETIREELVKQKISQDSSNKDTTNIVPDSVSDARAGLGSSSVSSTVPPRVRASLLDDFADTSTEPADYTGGDD